MGNCHVVGPDKALVISGGCCGAQRKRYITGGYAFACCCVTEVQRIELGIMTLKPTVTDCETSRGVRVNVRAVCQVKVMTAENEGQSPGESDFLKKACEQFLGKTKKEIENVLLHTLGGHLRSIIGTMTVEQLFQEREEFSINVREVAMPDLALMGMQIMSFGIQDLSDANGYLDVIGQEQAAKVKAKAQIESAEADRDAFVKEEHCAKISMDTKFKVDRCISDFQKDFKTKEATYLTFVNTAQAESALAYELQSSIQQQEIVKEELNVALVEKQMSIQVEEKEIIRREKELTANTRLPADAKAFQTRVLAEGSRIKQLRKAEGEAQQIRLVGSAEACSIEAIGKAEASDIWNKAHAYKDYGNAAKMKLVLDALPKIAAEVVAPLANVDEIVILGGGDGVVGGTSKLLAELPHTVRAVTGYDISNVMNKIPGATKVKK